MAAAGAGGALECTVQRNDVQSLELSVLLVVLCSRRRGGGRSPSRLRGAYRLCRKSESRYPRFGGAASYS